MTNRMSLQKTLLTDIQSEVLGYLEEHPDAFDTVEGIRQWWLLRRLAKYSTDRVQTAIDQLVETGFIETRLLDDGRCAYCRCADHNSNYQLQA
jgi:hypothetical protein